MAIYGKDNPYVVYNKERTAFPSQVAYTQDGGNWTATRSLVPYQGASRYGWKSPMSVARTQIEMPSGWNPFEAQLPWTPRASIGSDAQRQRGYMTGITPQSAPRMTYNRYSDKQQTTLNKMIHNGTTNFSEVPYMKKKNIRLIPGY